MTTTSGPLGRGAGDATRHRAVLGVRALIGSGDRIALVVLPVLVVGVVLDVLFPAVFGVGGPPRWLQVASAVVLTAGVLAWGWSVVLLLTRARAGDLITTGPYRLVAHPLYTSVALLVLPWVGFLLDTWLGALVGAAMYLAARLFAPAEERELAGRFGAQWDAYSRRVRIPWL